MMPPRMMLQQLLAIIGNNEYAMTFQTFGQYRTALMQQIRTIDSNYLTEKDSTMQPSEKMPMAAIAYDPEHPYPVALRNLSALQRLVFSGAVVQLDKLTTYITSAHGGMRPDPFGPWVLKLEVMGQSRTTHKDDIAIAHFGSKMHYRMEKARKQGARGWDDGSTHDVELAGLLVRNAYAGDYVSVANYAMMLDHRGADAHVLGYALEGKAKATAAAALDEISTTLFTQPAAAPARDRADIFAQALIAQGWHNDDIDCVAKIQALLADYVAITNANKKRDPAKRDGRIVDQS